MSAARPVAQLAEQRSPKPQVGGSIPSWPAKLLHRVRDRLDHYVEFRGNCERSI